MSSSLCVLRSFVDHGVEVAGVLGLSGEVAARVSDYRDLEPVARGAGLPFHSFVKVGEPGVEDFLRSCRADMLWVIGISQLVPDRLVGLAGGVGVGFHPTMLPRGRGRAPVAWTLLLGERAAVSLFHLSDEADSGDLIAQREVEVRPGDYAQDLIDRTNEVLYDVVGALAGSLRSGEVPRRVQDHSLATYYGKRGPADGWIDWSWPVGRVLRLVRAASRPYPGAFGRVMADGSDGVSGEGESGRLICWRGEAADGGVRGRGSCGPGEVLEIAPGPGSSEAGGSWSRFSGSLVVAAGDGAVRVTEWEVAGSVDLEVGMLLG